MALIVITLADNEDGSLDIQARSEPFIPLGDDEELTGAQIASQVMIASLESVFVAAEETEDDGA